MNPEQAMTPAQARVVEQLCLGKTNAEIATQLGLSEKTVKAHLTAIYKVAGCANGRQFLVRYLTREVPA